jgi:hypothetical protein
MDDGKRPDKLLVLGWALVVAGAVILFLRYPTMPSLVPAYRVLGRDPVWVARSPLSVARIAAMGVGQGGAATAMARSTRASSPWHGLWRWCVVAAGAKTLLECVGFASRDARIDVAMSVATGLLVVAACVAALVASRRLGAPPRLSSGAKISVALWLLVWGGFALCAAASWR